MSPKDQEKIGKTYTKEHAQLLGYIRKRIPLDYEAEDILQDVFYQLTRGFNELERIENLRAWLYRVANNRIIDNFRKKKLETVDVQSKGEIGEDGPLSLDEILPDLSSTPEQEQIKEIIWEVIDDTLEKMPLEQRDVFVLHEFEDLSFQEISDKTGIGLNTLISRKRYAVLELRKRLKHIYKQLNIK